MWSGVLDDSPYGEEIDGSINVISLRGPQKRYNIILKGIIALFSIGKVIRYINSAAPGVIFASTCELIAIFANELSKIKSKLVVIVHSDPSFSSVLIMQRGRVLKLRFFKLLSKLLIPRADRVICVSGGVAEGIANTGFVAQRKLGSIYNPVITKLSMEKSKESPTHAWLTQKERPVFVGVGRLSEEKNFSLLLRAFKIVSDKLDSVLIVAGEGPLSSELKKLSADLGIKSRVDFAGFLKNPYSLMFNSDVFVLSSNVEGLPTVLIEAMACGCQLVSTNCPSGPAEILEDGKYGRLVPMNDENALARAMLDALAAPIDKALLEKRAADFEEDKIGRQYIALAEELMGGV
jgi:glycosyltransferase involved in cell wall biosynthesis